MHRSLLLGGTLSAAFAVGLGAFGAHGLEGVITPERIEIYQTGNDYHFYHAFALVICGILALYAPNKWWLRARRCFALGLIGFSGSLYLLATRAPLGVEGWAKVLGPITPLGGLFFLLGWLFLAVGVWRQTGVERPTGT